MKAILPSMRFEKTVLQVIPALEAGGAERTTVEIARAIVRAGGKAIVATSGGRMAAELESVGGRIVSMPAQSKNPLVMFANRNRLVKVIEDEAVDVIHARSRAPAWSALWAARATATPYVATWHGAYGAGSAAKRFYNSGLARADLVIANSAFTAQSIRAMKAEPARLKIIPRGADLTQFDPAAVSRDRLDAMRAAWSLTDFQGLVLLLPARLTDWKGHRVALDACRLMTQEPAYGLGRDFRLIFAGDEQGRGGFAKVLHSGIEELGLQRIIRCVGHCSDMPAAYALADIVLSPSTRPEAFGRVAAEAGAMARVAIGADHGGARETIVPDETGFLAAAGSAEALAAAIAAAARLGVDGRAAMGAKARARIAAEFSVEAMTEATLRAYDDLLREMKGEAVRPN